MSNTFHQSHSGSGDNVVNVGSQPFSMTQERMELVLKDLKGRLIEGQAVKVIPHGYHPQTLNDAAKLYYFLQANGVNVVQGPGIGFAPSVGTPVTFQVLEGPLAGPAIFVDSGK